MVCIHAETLGVRLALHRINYCEHEKFYNPKFSRTSKNRLQCGVITKISGISDWIHKIYLTIIYSEFELQLVLNITKSSEP